MNELQKHRFELIKSMQGMFIPAEVVSKVKTMYKSTASYSPVMLVTFDAFLEMCVNPDYFPLLAAYNVKSADASPKKYFLQLQEVLGEEYMQKNKTMVDFMLSGEAVHLIIVIYQKISSYCFAKAKKADFTELSLLSDSLFSEDNTEDCVRYMKKLIYSLDKKPFSIQMYEALCLMFTGFEYVSDDDVPMLLNILNKHEFFIGHHAKKLRSALRL